MQKRYAYTETARNEMVTYKKGGICRKILLSILMFMFIYSFDVNPQMPSLTSMRIAAIAICIWGLFSQKKLFSIYIGNSDSERSFRHYLAVNLFLLLYTSIILLLWGKGTGETVTFIYINILTFSLAFYYGCKFMFVDVDELMQTILIVSMVQSVIIFASLLSPEVYSWIRSSFYSGSYFELSGKLGSMRGYALGIGCITSKGSQKLSLGIIACLYYILKKKKNMLYLISMIIITLASTAVARTGMIYTIIVLLFFLVTAVKNASKKAQLIITKVIIFLLIAACLMVALNFQTTLENVYWRFTTLFQGGFSGFFESYFKATDTTIPKLSLATLIGTGIWSGTAGCGLTINVDGGFLRTYFALGLIVAIGYYIFLLSNYKLGSKNIKGVEKAVCTISLIFILIGEFKEPLLFDWYYQTIVFVFMFMAEKDNCMQRKLEDKHCKSIPTVFFDFKRV